MAMTPAVRIAVLCFVSVAALCAPATAQQMAGTVSDLSVWRPAPGALNAVRTQCGAGNGDIEACFIAAMKNQGAPNTAIAFAQSMASRGQVYLKSFRKTGVISIGYFEYVFRANEMDGVAIVNGTPSPIDVDDVQYVTREMLSANAVYQQLLAKYPNISVWPGDRTNPVTPDVRDRNAGGQQVLVRYVLKDGCHACANVGSARVAFNFDQKGKFEGVRLLNVIPGAPPTTKSPVELDPAGPTGTNRSTRGESLVKASYVVTTDQHDSAVSGAGSSASPTAIQSSVGQKFTINLEGNRSTGYAWTLATQANPKLFKKIGESYSSKSPGMPGAGEIDKFVFRATGRGAATIVFNYSRPWEKNVPPAKTETFSITID